MQIAEFTDETAEINDTWSHKKTNKYSQRKSSRIIFSNVLEQSWITITKSVKLKSKHNLLAYIRNPALSNGRKEYLDSITQIDTKLEPMEI